MTSETAPLNRRAILDRAKNEGMKGDLALTLIARRQLLARVELAHPGDFMLKGGQALVARGVTSRSTRDIDVRADAKSAKAAAAALTKAARTSIGDGIEFEPDGEPVTLGAAETGGYAGVTVRLVATIGGESMARVNVDVVTAREPTGTLTSLTVPPPLDVPGLAPLALYVYPVEDHIADKLCATHQLYSAAENPSSRVRDLYDLCAIAASCAVDAATLGRAIRSEEDRRGLSHATGLVTPTGWRDDWPKMHRAAGAEAHVPAAYADAVAQAKRLLDPVLSGQVTAGTWDPARQAWA